MGRQQKFSIWISFLLASFAFGQTQQMPLSFEVASVKPPATLSPARIGCVGNRFAFGGLPFMRLVQWAYGLPPTRIQGLPDWVTDWVNKPDSMYEIEAKASSTVSDAQCKAMVQTLLADRFKLVARLEPREMRVFALTVAKKGSKMREVTSGSEEVGVHFNGVRYRTPGELPAGISMSQFARDLSSIPAVGGVVVDRTSLSGVYSFDLEWSIKDNDGLPAISTAVEEQLGLKLEATKAPIEMLVVSHIERPTAN
jgi:uncharacterized protein (TIGR03435 family)